jgi:hypothetical protein
MRKKNVGICYNMPSRQEYPILPGGPIGASGSGASVDKFESTLGKLKEYVEQGSDISLAVIKLFDGGEIQLLNKILKKYQEDCKFRKAIRDATTLTASMSALGYSFIKDRECMNNIDKLAAVAGIVALLNNLRLVFSRYNKKTDTPMVGPGGEAPMVGHSGNAPQTM